MAKSGNIFRVESIKSKITLDSKRVQMMVINAMKKEGNQMKKELESTTQYWVHKPTFDYKMHYRGSNVYIEAGLYGSSLGSQYWKYVNYGTAYRYVLFHPLYIPKSRIPGSFYTNRRGMYTVTKREGGSYTTDSKIQGVSRRRMRGIKARNWISLLRKKHRQTFVTAVTDAVQKGLQPK